METSKDNFPYSSHPMKIDKDNGKVYYEDDDDDIIDMTWPVSEGMRATSSLSKSSKQDHLYPYVTESDDFIDGGYDSSEDVYNHPPQTSRPPEVNLKNVLGGIFAIVTGRNKEISDFAKQQLPSSDVSFLGSKKNGDTYLHSSVYIPSAPPLFEPTGTDYSAYKEVLEAEPPEWLPDSATTACMQCNAPFTALTRGRHHCRFCGGIFCRACSKGRCLLPVKFRERNPQRVCDSCYDRLDPLQGVLINTLSNAVQVAKHDVMDWTSARGWLNLPVGLSMEYEIYKAANTLRTYSQVWFLYTIKFLCS